MFHCSVYLNIFVHILLIHNGESVELFDRLNLLINYFWKNAESRTPDAMLGVYLCKAQLLQMKEKVIQGDVEIFNNTLNMVNNLCERYEHENEATIWNTNSHNGIVVKHLVNSDFWLNYNADDPIIYGNMTQTKDGKIAYDNFMEKIDTGMPEATDSDRCLAELLTTNECSNGLECLNIMSVENESHGYHLTHKLLYFMVMKQGNYRQCLPSDQSIEATIYSLCSLIWNERSIIIALNTPNFLHDLFIEQTLLCGLNGFMAFVEEDVIKQIISWQNIQIGCYEYFDYQSSSMNIAINHRSKRSAIQLAGNCSDHASGLAAGSFGLFAKIALFDG